MPFLPRLLLLFISFAVALPADTRQEVLARLNAAETKRAAHDLKGMIEDYNYVLEHEPGFAHVWAMRAEVRRLLKDLSGARADVAQALVLNPEEAEAYAVRAGILFDEDEHYPALQAIDRALELEPQAWGYRATRGKINAALWEFDAAREDLDEAIKRDPKDARSLLLRARVHQRLKMSQAALEDYTRVMELQPDHAESLLTRAWLRFAQGDWAGCIRDARKLLSFDPKNYLALQILGYAQFAQDDLHAAAISLAQAADLTGEDEEVQAFTLLMRHLALLRLGTPDDRLAKAQAAWVDDAWWTALARYCVGDLDEEQLDALADETPGDWEKAGAQCEAHFYVGMRRLLAGDRATARLRFQACLAAGRPDYAEHTLAEKSLHDLKRR